jgi:hypothetical protein
MLAEYKPAVRVEEGISQAGRLHPDTSGSSPTTR